MYKVRRWPAVIALFIPVALIHPAMDALGGGHPRLDYYRLVPEWITGMGLMTTTPHGG